MDHDSIEEVDRRSSTWLKTKRLYNELREFEESYPGGLLIDNGLLYGGLMPDDKDRLDVWNASIIGPENTPYAGGVFHVQIRVSEDYPWTSPIVRFLTPIYHPRVNNKTGMVDSESGEIFDWSYAFQLSRIIIILSGLMCVSEVSCCWGDDEWRNTAIEHTKKYARPFRLRNPSYYASFLNADTIHELRLLDTILHHIGSHSETIGIDLTHSIKVRKEQKLR